MLAVSSEPVGIDLESCSKARDDLAEFLLDPVALDAYNRLPLEKRAEAFASSWTEREAFVKAIGLGIGDGWQIMKRVFEQRPLLAPASCLQGCPIHGKWHLRGIHIWPRFACSVCTSHRLRGIRLMNS